MISLAASSVYQIRRAQRTGVTDEALLRNNAGQVIHALLPTSPIRVIRCRSKSREVLTGCRRGVACHSLTAGSRKHEAQL